MEKGRRLVVVLGRPACSCSVSPRHLAACTCSSLCQLPACTFPSLHTHFGFTFIFPLPIYPTPCPTLALGLQPAPSPIISLPVTPPPVFLPLRVCVWRCLLASFLSLEEEEGEKRKENERKRLEKKAGGRKRKGSHGGEKRHPSYLFISSGEEKASSYISSGVKRKEKEYLHP